MDNTHKLTTKVIKRRKVSKACANCRRRKIKCTGTNPCTNCAAYKCPCEYVDKPKQFPKFKFNNTKNNTDNNSTPSPLYPTTITTANTTPTTTISNDSSNSNDNIISKTVPVQSISESKTSVSSLLSHDIQDEAPLPQFRKHISQLHNINSNLAPSLPLYQDTSLNSSDSRIELNISPQLQKLQNELSNDSSSSTNKHDNNDDTVTKKRKNKKPKKILNINEPLFEDNGLYFDDLESQPEYISLVEAISQMESINNPNDVLKNIIKETKEKLDTFIRSWKPSIDFNKLDQFKDSKSVETKLMKNKYRNIIYLGEFASLNTLGNFNTKVVSNKMSNHITDKPGKSADEQPSNLENVNNVVILQQQSFLQHLPLVDELFGMYSPVDALSLRGVGSLVQQYATVKNKDTQAKMKATVYILLRFYDMCCLHLNEVVISVANPLGNYLERNCGNSYNSTINHSRKDLVHMIINKFPQPFTEVVTGVSNKDLLKLLDYDLDMFRTVLKMYELYRIEFEQMAMKIVSKNSDLALAKIGAYLDHLINFCELQDLLMTLCYSYYNATLYHLDDYNSLDYIELLLIFLDNQFEIEHDYGYEKILSVALDSAHKIGLHRWEYYVNLDEALAERRRVAWWKLYEHEKMFSMKRGFMSGINDDKVNCLLPEPMRRVGFVDHADFLSRMLTFEPDGEIFKNMSVKDLKTYGKCAMSQVLSDLYIKVMFSDKYTSIKNVALPQSIREKYLNEIHEYYEFTKKRLERVKKHTIKLFEIAAAPRVDINNALPYDDKFEANEYVVLYSLYSTLIVKSCCSLTSRLMHKPKTNITKSRLLHYHKEIHKIFNKTSKFLMELEIRYEMWRLFEFYYFTFALACHSMSDKYNFTTEYDIINLLKIFNSVLVFSEGFDELCMVNKSISQSQTIKKYGRSFSLIAILIRMLLLHYMVKNNVKLATLKNRVEHILKSRNEPTDIVTLIDVFMDHDSYAFKFILAPVQESGFHLNMQQVINSTYSHNLKNTEYINSKFIKQTNSIKNDPSINKGSNQQDSQVPINVYPPSVLHDSKGNKISIRNNPTTLNVFNNTKTFKDCSSNSSSNSKDLPNNVSAISMNNTTLLNMERPLQQLNNNLDDVKNKNDTPLHPRHDISQDNNHHDNNQNTYPTTTTTINNTYSQDDIIFSKVPVPSSQISKTNSTVIAEQENHNDIATNNNQLLMQPSLNSSAYNFGTLEEFVNNTDLNDLYKSLWNDNSVDFF